MILLSTIYLFTITGFILFFTIVIEAFGCRQEIHSRDEDSTLDRRTVLLAQWIILLYYCNVLKLYENTDRQTDRQGCPIWLKF